MNKRIIITTIYLFFMMNNVSADVEIEAFEAPKAVASSHHRGTVFQTQQEGLADWDGIVYSLEGGLVSSDYCEHEYQKCRCSNTGRSGYCSYGPSKKGLYCQC